MTDREIFNRKSLLSAIEGWYAGNLSELDAYRLKEQLRTNSDTRQIFVEYGDLLASLEMNSCCENPEAVDSILSSALLAEERAKGRFFSWSVAVIAVLVFAVTPLLWGLTKGKTPVGPLAERSVNQEEVRSLTRLVIPAHAGAPGICATLIELTELPQPLSEEIGTNAETAAPPLSWKIGDTFSTDETFLLPGGSRFARLKFASGAVLTVEGPSEIRLLSGNAIELRSGRILGAVPPEATGFLVYTDYGIVRDIGTEFAISIQDQSLFVSVLTGLVECLIPQPGGNLIGPPLPLAAGEHLQLNRVTAQAVKTRRSHADLEGVVSYHRGIQTSGDVRFLAGRPPRAKKNPEEYQGAICLFEESRQLPVKWDPQAKSLLFSRENVRPEMLPFWSEQVVPDIVSESLLKGGEQASLLVDCYLVNLQSPDNRTIVRSGDIVFGREIIGVIRANNGLSSTDWVSPDSGFAQSWKSEKQQARGSREGNDTVVIHPDRMAISMELQASGAGDQMRIFVRSNGTKSEFTSRADLNQ